MYFPVSGVEVSPLIPLAVSFVVSFFTSMGGISGAFLLLPFQMSVLGFTSPTSHILICSRHCLRPLRIRPQHRSKFQTPSLVPAQSNPDLQSDRPVRCEVLFVGRYSFQSSSFRSLILVNSFVLLVISMRLRATACAAMSIS